MLSPRESVELNRMLGAPPQEAFKDEFAKHGLRPKLLSEGLFETTGIVEMLCTASEELSKLGDQDAE